MTETESVIFKGNCLKYTVPERCYKARDWAAAGACLEAKAEVYVITEPKPNMGVRVREVSKSNSNSSSSNPVWDCDAYEDTVFRSEDSERYFVLREHSATATAATDETAVIGIGFATTEESTKFVGALEPAVPVMQSYVPQLQKKQGTGAAAAAAAAAATAADEGDYLRAVSPDVTIRTQEPEVSFGETSVHTTRASASAAECGEGVAEVSSSSSSSIGTVISEKEEKEKGGVDADATKEGNEAVMTDAEERNEEKKRKEEEVTEKEEEKQEEEEVLTGTRRHCKEDNSQEVWRRHRKHVFALSIAGKPIYSRFGDEQQLAPFMASMMALVSFVEDCQDKIRYFVAGERQVVFHVRGPVIAVGVCSTAERRADIERALFYVHSQLAAVLTFGTITKIFSRRPDFDLRDLLSDADVTLLDNIIHRTNREPSIMLDAVEPLRMHRALRASVEAAVADVACPELLFAFLFSGFNLIHMARPRRFSLRAADVHLLMNFVNSSESFRSSCVWTPLCLPLLDNRGFFHAHIGYIAENVALVLISSHVEAFYKINECATLITQRLTSEGALDDLAALCSQRTPSQQQQLPLPLRYPVSALRVSHLRHFVYKSLPLVQITTPHPGPPDAGSHARTKTLLRLYQWARSQMARPASGELAPAATPPHKLYYRISSTLTIMTCYTKTYELYAAFGPLVKKYQALAACNAIAAYVSANEDDLFVKPSTW